LTDADVAIARVLSDARDGKPVSSFGARAYQELKDAAERSPTVKERIVRAFEPLQMPVDGRGLRLSAIACVLGVAMDGGVGPLSALMGGSLDTFVGKSASTIRDQVYERFYADVVAGSGGVEEALGRARIAEIPGALARGVALTEMKSGMRVVTEGLERDRLSPIEKVKDPIGWARAEVAREQRAEFDRMVREASPERTLERERERIERSGRRR
jgi:hypothetical protein